MSPNTYSAWRFSQPPSLFTSCTVAFARSCGPTSCRASSCFSALDSCWCWGLRFTGGLEAATQELARRRPPAFGKATIRIRSEPDQLTTLPKGTWLRGPEDQYVRTAERVERKPGAVAFTDVTVIELQSPGDREHVDPTWFEARVVVTRFEREPFAFGEGRAHTYIFPPGHHRTAAVGFLPLTLAFSFFFFWPFGSAGQPSNMVRLMAFRNTRTLKLSMITVAIYFSFIYFSLVVIFCCARVLMPGMEIEADRVMPEMAVQTTERANVPWMAGFLLAAPFAAVMSSVDSFLLLVSSSLVRDIYQRHVHPTASESWLKRVTYGGTISIGILAALGPASAAVPAAIIVDASGYLSVRS